MSVRCIVAFLGVLAAGSIASAQDITADTGADVASTESTPSTTPSTTTTTTTTTTEATPTPEQLGEARDLFRRAVELGDQDRWAEALVLFRRSLELVPRPSTQFNVGFALYRLGQLREAIGVFDAYLAATEGETNPLRDEATTRRAQAVQSLAALTVTVSPETAQLRVDGAADPSTGAARTLALDPGRHLLLATAPNHHDAQLEVSLLAAEQRAVSLTLEPVPTAPPIDGPITHDEPEHEHTILDEPLFWILSGVAVVAIGVGVGVGVALGSGTESPYPGSTGVVLRMP